MLGIGSILQSIYIRRFLAQYRLLTQSAPADHRPGVTVMLDFARADGVVAVSAIDVSIAWALESLVPSPT